jgi:Na+-driven multidrug efflux pump
MKQVVHSPFINHHFLCLWILFGISGVAIGSGWQAVVAYVNLACYYVVGLPIGCVLGFKTSLGVVVSRLSLSLSLSLRVTACFASFTLN